MILPKVFWHEASWDMCLVLTSTIDGDFSACFAGRKILTVRAATVKVADLI